MTADNTPLTDEEREELVAFLDGELKGQAARDVRSKLSLDPRYRTEAEMLRRTWQMLDFLPEPQVSPNFSHRTLDRVSALRPKQTGTVRAGLWRWAQAVGWAAAVLVAAAAGFNGFKVLTPPDTTDEELSRDLRVIENRRYYQHVDNIDFLIELAQPELFGDDHGGL